LAANRKKRCKVDRVIDEYELSTMNDRLVDRRRGEDGEAASLRDLSSFLNREVLERAMERNGMNPLDGEVENVYRLLTDADVSRGERTRLRKRLEREGIDVEAVEKSFVSHPTIGSHLTDCLGVEQEDKEETDPIERASERVLKLQNRSEAVMVNTLEQLVDGGDLRGGELSVFVDARVMCETCGTQSEIRHFIENGGCECDDAE
jgi:hypothetical protein